MSSYQSFAVAGAGAIGKYVVDALIAKKAAGIISTVSILTRSVSIVFGFQWIRVLTFLKRAIVIKISPPKA